MLACADIEEGVACARPASAGRILVFGALSVSDLDGVFESRPDADDLDARRRRARCRRPPRRAARALRYHLKIDTGMNRLGFRHDNLRRTLPELLASPQPRARRGLHALRHRRRPGAPAVRRAARAVRGACSRRSPRWASRPRLRHAANSAALLRDSRVWFDFVRPGPAALRRRAAAARVDAAAAARACRSAAASWR